MCGERADLDALYERFRGYVIHEDNLINHRTTWLVLIQSFLVASYGFAISRKFSGFANIVPEVSSARVHETVDQIDRFLLVISVVGIFTAAISFLSIFAARLSISNLSKKFTSVDGFVTDPINYPSITGGGSRWATFLGFSTPLAIPFLLMGIWVYMLKVTVEFSFNISVG